MVQPFGITPSVASVLLGERGCSSSREGHGHGVELDPPAKLAVSSGRGAVSIAFILPPVMIALAARDFNFSMVLVLGSSPDA